MTATKAFATCANLPGFDVFVASEGRWCLTAPDGTQARGKDWVCKSTFGEVRAAVVVDDQGNPSFDRPIYYEAPNVNIVAWGRGKDGVVKIAIIRQPRPHADDPRKPGDDHAPVVFGQIPMGFKERIIGKDMIARYESSKAAATREALEETGCNVIIEIEEPKAPWHNPCPSFVATWSELLFVQVDLEQITALKPDRHEPIFSAEYIALAELMRRIREGEDEQGALYRGATSLSAWMVFFATHPELLMT